MHACLYGLAHAVIVALGCAPGLGFVHVGHECSFVYDIADLYKAEVTIPIAFEVAAQAPEDLPAVVRRRVRDAMVEHHILERMVHDIRWLLPHVLPHRLILETGARPARELVDECSRGPVESLERATLTR